MSRWGSLYWGLLGLIFACTAPVAAGDAVEIPSEELAELIRDVRVIEIASGAVPGPVCALGEGAFPVVLGRMGGGRIPVVAAAKWGAGRVIALGHDRAFFVEEALRSADTRSFISNCIAWLKPQSRARSPVLRVLTCRLDSLAKSIQEDTSFGDVWVQVISVGQFDAEVLGSAHILILPASILRSADIAAVATFVRRGGGLMISETPWGWLQLNPGKNLSDHPGNQLLRQVGLVWGNGYVERTHPKGFTATLAPGPELHFQEALEIFSRILAGEVDPPSETFQQLELTFRLALEALPGEDPAVKVFRRVLNTHGGFSGKAAHKHTQAQLLALALQSQEWLRLPPEEVKPHPAAADFPGTVPPNAPRTKRKVRIPLMIPGWHSTGLYAAPGETITVTISELAPPGKIALQIGCHTDTLWHLPQWQRMPQIVRREMIDGWSHRMASPFGGLVYLDVVRPTTIEAWIDVEIQGAVEAPSYVLGETSAAVWQKMRNLPAPWAELGSERIVLTLPTEDVRTLDDPVEVLQFWDSVVAVCDRLAGGPIRRGPHRYVCDIQISAGYMHSGYPIMTHLDVAPVMVDINRLRLNQHPGVWGLFHELGHNYQSQAWTFAGTGEVTCNLFTLYVFDHLCQVTRSQSHPELSPTRRQQKLRDYLAQGAKFADWQKDPFLALQMYAQLQEAFGWEPFEKVFAEYRSLSPGELPRDDAEKRDQWFIRFSRVVGFNLGPFFDTWGVPVSASARAAVSTLPSWNAPEFGGVSRK